MARSPFEADSAELQSNLDRYVDAVFASLESDFLLLPKGRGFLEYPEFEAAYEVVKQATLGFRDLAADRVLSVVAEQPVSIVVLRTMLGFSPPEWAYETTLRTGVAVEQGWIRNLDRRVRINPNTSLSLKQAAGERLRALVETACNLLQEGVPPTPPEKLHRLDKADTRSGAHSLRTVAEIGVPYPMLLYERYLGRPFAGHRDSVSELSGGGLETEIERLLSEAGISFRKTKRAERIEGFDQAPDFIVPSEYNPRIVVEAKVTEDDGTARDKVTRVQHLAALRDQRPPGERFELIACIAGRGFRVRREDMKKLLLATQGKVFTLQNLDMLVETTGLRAFRAR